MKTAMQELIEELRQTRDEGESEYKTAYNLAIAIANQYLEKEKEQIIKAASNEYVFQIAKYLVNKEESNLSLFEWRGVIKIDAEKYYNQTYKQTK